MDSINPINILIQIPYNDTYLENNITPDTQFYCVEQGGGLYVYSYTFRDDYDFLLATISGEGHHTYTLANVSFNLKKGSYQCLNWDMWNGDINNPVYDGTFILFNVSRGDTLKTSSRDAATFFKFFSIL